MERLREGLSLARYRTRYQASLIINLLRDISHYVQKKSQKLYPTPEEANMEAVAKFIKDDFGIPAVLLPQNDGGTKNLFSLSEEKKERIKKALDFLKRGGSNEIFDFNNPSEEKEKP